MSFHYITAEAYAGKDGVTETIEDLRALAAQDGECMVCGDPVWRLGGCGMCFSCTTGEADNSYDYELIPTEEAAK